MTSLPGSSVAFRCDLPTTHRRRRRSGAGECGRIFRRFAEAGGNFIDTANNYTDGSSEDIVGSLVEGEREGSFSRRSTRSRSTERIRTPAATIARAWSGRWSRACRLRTDYVDLLWLHRRDATTPIEEAVRALDDQDVALTAEERQRLDEAGKPPLGFPRSFLESPDVRELIYGDTWERLLVSSAAGS